MTNCNEDNGLSVIVPVYNEEAGLKSVIEELIEILDNLDLPAELIIVNDGSVDGTSEILEAFAHKAKILQHASNRGYGAALKTGISNAAYPLIAITDADGTYPNHEFPKLLSKMDAHDMVVGSRNGQQVAVPLIRRPAKWFLNKIANYLLETKIPDLNSGFRIFRRKRMERYRHILPNGFSFTTTITLSMISDGFPVYYEPINYYKRDGKSKIKPNDALNFFMLITRTVTYFNPLRIFLPISIVLFFLGFLRLGYEIFFLFNLTDSSTLLLLFAVQIGLIGIIADLIVKRSIR
jgi:glycosyltransferase involved in cell wall biosynthesis